MSDKLRAACKFNEDIEGKIGVASTDLLTEL